MNKVGKNDALIAEYKEMRDEIRAAWTQYYSILVGIGLTGIATSFYFAVSRCDEWLFLVIPLLTVSWISLITTISANIKHISNYIEKIEEAIGSPKVMFYESKYAKRLWGSDQFKWLHFFIILPLLVIQVLSIGGGYLFLVRSCYSITISRGFVIIMSILTGIVFYMLKTLPKTVSKRFYDEKKGHKN